jgi:leucyl-tRNA synthetase
MVWKKLGKTGFAVKAPWPVAEEEDKILTRQAQLMRDSLKRFRTQAGKAKKGWQKSSILVSDVYPQWKIDTLTWMQTQYKDACFSDSFMSDLKDWTAATVADKKMIKFIMQFASFRKREVEDVGETALDILLPFDQKAILSESLSYMKAQLNLADVDIIKLGADDANVPDRIAENVEPGKPFLWMR